MKKNEKLQLHSSDAGESLGSARGYGRRLAGDRVVLMLERLVLQMRCVLMDYGRMGYLTQVRQADAL